MDFQFPEILEGESKSSPFMNCIRNNYRHIRKWAKRTHTNCFRIYDRQMHHYPLSIDFYAGRFCIHYFSPHRNENSIPVHLEEEVFQVLSTLFNASKEDIYWRTRFKREKLQQYDKSDTSKDFFEVLEYGVVFRVNLVDYLDTGLFLDHRETRRLVSTYCKDKRVLNLFAYTCSFSVHAAKAGARFTKSVDMSNTYTQWGKENFRLNGLSLKNNVIVREDCLKFLKSEVFSNEKYDVIIIDPPTISRSKKMDQMFDVQQDYVTLINQALQLLSDGGIIFFSTNSRKFIFDETLFPNQCQEISHRTLPLDFHDKKIHRCWKIRKAQ